MKTYGIHHIDTVLKSGKGAAASEFNQTIVDRLLRKTAGSDMRQLVRWVDGVPTLVGLLPAAGKFESVAELLKQIDWS